MRSQMWVYFYSSYFSFKLLFEEKQSCLYGEISGLQGGLSNSPLSSRYSSRQPTTAVSKLTKGALKGAVQQELKLRLLFLVFLCGKDLTWEIIGLGFDIYRKKFALVSTRFVSNANLKTIVHLPPLLRKFIQFYRVPLLHAQVLLIVRSMHHLLESFVTVEQV